MKNNDKIVVVQFRFKDRSDDIIWGQIKRASNALKTQLELGRIYCFKKFIHKG